MITLYGIKTCSTVRKARDWLKQHNIDYHYHDHRFDGVDPMQLRLWVHELGWQTLLNKRSTTWRTLPAKTRENMDETLALAVMEDQPTIIKRPLLDLGTERFVGFSEKHYQRLFSPPCV